MNAALNPYQLFPFDYRVREAVPVICRHFLNYHEIPGDCQLILIALSVFYQLQECVFQRLGRLIEACQHHIVGCQQFCHVILFLCADEDSHFVSVMGVHMIPVFPEDFLHRFCIQAFNDIGHLFLPVTTEIHEL